jgi:hypothetical protein
LIKYIYISFPMVGKFRSVGYCVWYSRRFTVTCDKL